MSLFDDIEREYPTPVYKSGQYLIGLNRPIQWYVRRAVAKGKTFGTSHVKTVIPLIVDKVFFKDIDEEALDLSLNLDCIIGSEAEYVKTELEHRITGELLSYFPKIASHLDDRYWWLTENMELVINVPDDYEEQRGNFF